MLQARTEEQKKCIEEILGESGFWFPDASAVGITIDDFIYFDEMAAVVDFLRKEDAKRRANARRTALKSGIDKLWISGEGIFLRGADPEKAEAFILSLAEFGYDTQELLNEYKKTGKITI